MFRIFSRAHGQPNPQDERAVYLVEGVIAVFCFFVILTDLFRTPLRASLKTK